MQQVVERFPGWNEVTIANLHSLFLLFDNQSNGMLGFDDLLVFRSLNTVLNGKAELSATRDRKPCKEIVAAVYVNLSRSMCL